MKSKPALMLFSFFSMFVFVGLAAADAPASEAVLSDILATPAECGDSEVDIIANLFAPPIVKMSYTDSCGACSVSQCRGIPRGQGCWNSFEQRWLFCIPQATNFCPGTQDWACQCAEMYY